MPLLSQDIECHQCKHEFNAKEQVNGSCPICGNKYTWAWDGDIWSSNEYCFPIFKSEHEDVKNAFLLSRSWI